MAINYDSIPDEKPAMNSFLIPKGNYKAKVEEAKMIPPKSGGKEYLQMTAEVYGEDGAPMPGKVWIKLFDSDKALPQYQVKRFTTAIGLELTGNVELSDIAKLVPGREFRVDLIEEERTDGKAPQNSIVDINAGDIFYAVDEDRKGEGSLPEMTVPSTGDAEY